MRLFKYTLLISLIFVGLNSCHTKGTGIDNFNKEVYSPDYASGFQILGVEGGESTLLRVKNPWQGAEELVSDLLILRDGEKIPSGFAGQVIEGAAERVVCMSSTYVAMMDALGEVKRVVGVSGLHFVANQYVSENTDLIGDVGYDGNINYELLVSLDPDLVMIYGVNGSSAMVKKLTELGIPYVYIGEYLEESPLGKSEWMVAIGEILGLRDKAVEVFGEIPRRYGEIKRAIGNQIEKRVKVMINTPYLDTWYMASTSSYVARLIKDAGGEYIYRDNNSNKSLPIDIEQAAVLASEADVWINVDGINSIGELSSRFSKFADIPCVLSGQVYKNDRRTTIGGGNDFWESGVVYPDKVLADLVKVFYPHLAHDYEFTYYRKLD